MSDVVPAGITAISQGGPVPQPTATQPNAIQPTGGNFPPQSGNIDPALAVTAPATAANVDAKKKIADAVIKPAPPDNSSLQARVQSLNKSLNDSGRPNQFRIAPQSSGQTVQEINPSNGAVIGEFAAAEFPALTRSLGVSGVLVDSQA